MPIASRVGHLESKKLLDEANEIVNTKDSAQSALAIKKILTRKRRVKPQITLEKITEYFSTQFWTDSKEEEQLTFPSLVTQSEVEIARTKLKNNKATGPDSVTGEDIKNEDPETLTKKLNDLIMSKDSSLTEGFLCPIEKPGKDASRPESYRPVILLSAYRKLLSLIVLQRINPIIDASLSDTQFAYRRNRSTGDIVLSHKYMVAGALSKKFNKVCAGIDMSKAFDNVLRGKLMDILRKRGVQEGEIGLINLLLSNTTMKVKMGKQIGAIFKTNKGVPQGDGLSPRLFTVYLDEALREIDNKCISDHDSYSAKGTATILHGHDYQKNTSPALPGHMEYADDVDFLCDSKEEAEEVVKIAKEILSTYNLCVNDEKTELFEYHKETDLRKIKKLGTILDEGAEISRRKHLAQFAMSKYRRIWKNNYINTKTKMKIYNIYVRSILLYNCSTWSSNKTIAKSLDSFHRKQLRSCLNNHYPNLISSKRLYEVTNESPISDHIKRSRLAHLGHILRRNHPTRNILHHIFTLPSRGRGTANILKTYVADLESDNYQTWITRALAKIL